MALAAVGKGGLRFVCLALAALLCACASPRQDAEALGRRHQLSARIVPAGPFNLYSMAPASWVADQPLTLYIEGDGYAFVTSRQLADDPTPRHPLVLGLAVQDPSPNVVYVARPCQYVTGPDRRNCHPAFWSAARYGEDVMDAMGAAVDYYLRLSGAKRVVLYGYSGGGAIAALLAARRDDVARFATVAGVLDTNAWTDLDDSTPLTHSFNPADFADRLAAIPQIHLVGKDDTRVPPQVAAAFVRRFPAGHRPPIRIMPGYDHDCCWVEHWPEILHELF